MHENRDVTNNLRSSIIISQIMLSVTPFYLLLTLQLILDGFDGLVVSMLASGSNPAEAVGFFRYMKKSSACLPSEGK
jgi:hypothetical protein